MALAQGFLTEFEQEAKTTRKFLERLPEDKLEWRPHPKSMTAGQLALHIASVPGRLVEAAQQDEIPAPDFGRVNPQPASTAEVLKVFDESVATVQKLLPTFSDDQMSGIWRMKKGDKEVMSMARSALFRNILLNHLYHHRGQFGVYLRLVGAKVPSSYGPSGDELPDSLQG